MTLDKRIQGVLLTSIVFLIALSLVWFYSDEALQDDSLSQEEFTKIQIKAEADELFINKEYEKAFERYKLLVEKTNDSSILVHRKQIQKEIENKDLDRGALINILKNCPEFNLKYKESNVDLIESSELFAYTQICFQNLQKVTHTIIAKAANEPEKKVLTFKSKKGNQVRYLGEIKEGRATGFGIGIWDTEGVYEGEWLNNHRHGTGIHQAKNGETYEGEWIEDERTGKGKFTFRNGDYYTGEWKKNKRSGFGTVISFKGDTLVHGYWKDDSFDKRKTREMSRK